MFAGTPDQVYDQIVEFYRAIGGFGHFLMMTQAGPWITTTRSTT